MGVTLCVNRKWQLVNRHFLEGFTMATQAQVSANCRNAAKSTGPRTTVGKAVVAQNAIRHGLLARQNVVTGEDPQEFDLHRREMLGELRPADPVESVLAEQIVSLSWRLKRAGRLQNEVFDSLLAKEIEKSMWGFRDELTPKDEVRLRSDPGSDPSFAVGRMITKDYLHASVLDRLQIYERRIESSLCRIMRDLESRQLRRKPDSGDDAPVSKASCPRIEVENTLRIEGETPATQPPAGPELVADSAKQSQSLALEGGHSPPCESGVDHSRPHGQTSLPVPPVDEEGTTDCAKQSQSADDTPCETKPIGGAGPACP
jgi:hypothetical protein